MSRLIRAGLGPARFILATAVLAVACAAAPPAPAERPVSAVPVLTDADLSAWESWEFSGTTRYSRVDLAGQTVLKSVSDAAASGIYRKIRVDLEKTPVLHWNWRVDNTLGDIDETSKGGDDYPARIYVVASHPVFFWKTTAISYVWSSVQPAGSTWPNAFSANARMLAVRSGSSGLQRWHRERRNVREDFQKLFGEDVRYIDAVAVMTDTDNTGRRAVAYYGDIWFSP